MARNLLILVDRRWPSGASQGTACGPVMNQAACKPKQPLQLNSRARHSFISLRFATEWFLLHSVGDASAISRVTPVGTSSDLRRFVAFYPPLRIARPACPWNGHFAGPVISGARRIAGDACGECGDQERKKVCPPPAYQRAVGSDGASHRKLGAEFSRN
jgi:hypothetical protein